MVDPSLPRPEVRLPAHSAMEATAAHLDRLTKPRGSLGRLESLAVQLSGITGELAPAIRPATVAVMAADHGVTVEGVSAYPQEVTVQMVGNFLRGGAAINVLARLFGLGLRIVDMGVAGDNGPNPSEAGEDIRYDLRRIRRGTGNMVNEPAMSIQEAGQAVGVGLEIARDEFSRGTRCICLGEMGIGNTTAASAILSAFTGEDPASLVGPGTGIDSRGLERKAEAIRRAISRHSLTPSSDPMQVLSAVGGLEIAGLVGIILGAAGAGRPVVLDGFITGAAALVAVRLEPRTVGYMIASHRSSEPAHAAMLELMDLRPLLDLDLRLGEGTGAALAFQLLEAAVAVASQMETFDSAGVSKAVDGDRRTRQ